MQCCRSLKAFVQFSEWAYFGLYFVGGRGFAVVPLLGGVELEIDVPGSDSGSMRRVFWAQDGVDFFSLYEKAAFQAICFLQSLYGFVVLDYNYHGMMTYRELARSAVVLAASLVRSSGSVVGGDASAAVGDVNAASCWQMLHAWLVSTACMF